MKRHPLLPAHPVYTALLYLCLPAILLRLLWRARRNPGYRQRWGERFGIGAARARGVIWVHAVSVGEVNVAVPLVQQLKTEFPDTPLLLTTTTPTGSDQALRRFGTSVLHQYLPYDAPGAIRRFLNRYQPRFGVILETELWPNLSAACARRGTPLFLANARLSDRSFGGYRRLSRTTSRCLRRFQGIFAQSEQDAARFRDLGAVPVTVRVTGNMKFDDTVDTDHDRQEALKAALHTSNRPVWIAGSSHAGEEEQLLAAHNRLRESHPDALLILAPRHPERFSDVSALLKQQHTPYCKRSDRQPCQPRDVVLLADSMGELPYLYALGQVAFVGGSLVPIGGHNLLEPLRCGVPVLFGPHMDNFRDIEQLTLHYGAGERVETSQELAHRLDAYLSDPRLQQTKARNAARLLADCRGATDRTMAALRSSLGDLATGTRPENPAQPISDE